MDHSDRPSGRKGADLIGRSGAAGAQGSATGKLRQAIDGAKRCIDAGALGEARGLLEPLARPPKPDVEALFLLGVLAELEGSPPLAANFARRALRLRANPEVELLLARALRRMGETDECLAACDRADTLRPGNQGVLLVRAGALEEAGRFDEAASLVEPLVGRLGDKAPPPLSYEWAKLLVHRKNFDEAIALIDSLLDENPPEDLRRTALHLKAKACDRSGRFGDAVEAARGANQIGELEFSPELYEEQVSQLIENWSAEAVADFPEAKCGSELPVFVAGMPRSGTSLIDQIIDAHPKAAGVGELSSIENFAARLSSVYDPEVPPPGCFGPLNERRWTKVASDYVRDLKKRAPKDAERVVNKALGNNKLIGLIARLFPKTRVIHAIRDPRDVAVSCFMGGFNHAVHPWTTRFEWIASAWAQSRRMMRHWEASLDVPILEVRYERLVNDPDSEFPRIIDFLGLEWDDACREFHTSRRTVRTLSYDQVNRPLYTSSAGRNANYAEFLSGVDFPDYEA